MEIALNDYSAHYIIDNTVISKSGKSYEILEKIGGGGNGVVYECIDTRGDEFAIKFLLKTNEKMKKRFFQEIALLKRVNNEYIIQYFDEGEVEGFGKKTNEIIPFVVMEKADCNLREYICRGNPQVYEIVAGQFRGLCSALAELHRYAIHRDIKPENILVKGERLILSDFGLCKLLDAEEGLSITRDNEKVGPMFWISPEAVTKYYFNEGDINESSDVYQLCMVFLFVVTKTFPGGQMQVNDITGFPQELIRLFLDAIAYNANKRPTNGQHLLDKFNHITYGG